MSRVEENKGPSKSIIIAIIIGVLLIAGGASAFFIFSKTPKEQYFQAEIKTMLHAKDLVEDRYADELKWNTKKGNSVTESTYDLSLDSSDLDDFGEEIMQILDNSTVSLRVATDPKKKNMEAEVSASIMGISVDDFKAYVTDEKLIVSLPFYDELFQLKDEDFGKFIKTFDEDYSGSEELGLADLFGNEGILTESNRAYLQEEYMVYLYDSIPDTAFTTEEEEISISGETFKTDRISMVLTEAEVKTLLLDLLEKAKKDPKFEQLMKESLNNLLQSANYTNETELPYEYDEVLKSLIDNVNSLQIPDGLTSTIWNASNIIVKRDLELSIGETAENIVTLRIDGTQLLDNETQVWDYNFTTVNLNGEDNSLFFKGDLSFDDGESSDQITLLDDYEKGLKYTGKDKLEGNERSFNHTIEFVSEFYNPSLSWNGDSLYAKDSMSVEHAFTLQIRESEFNLYVNEKGKIIKKVSLPGKKEPILNLGEMDQESLETLMDDLSSSIESWGMDIITQIDEELN